MFLCNQLQKNLLQLISQAVGSIEVIVLMGQMLTFQPILQPNCYNSNENYSIFVEQIS